MTLISRVAPDTYDAAAGPEVASGTDSPGEAPGPRVSGDTTGAAGAVRRVSGAAAAEDGRIPLNEATLLALRHHGLSEAAMWVASEGDEVVGFALASRAPEGPAAGSVGSAGSAVEVNVVVAPAARGRGAGRALAEAVVEAFGSVELTAWSHGNHPAAARLAAALGAERVRDLWVMRRPLSAESPLPALTSGAGGVVVRPFRPGQDEEAFLAVNAEAFAGHPEQGAMTRADLDARMAEPWFDPVGFLVAEPADAPQDPEANDAVESPSLLGFHWTKVHDEHVGEVYVVGISPAAQGRGLGKLLTLTGLHHLHDRGLHEVILYVEADNAAAVAVYEGLGFTHSEADTDVMYRRQTSAGPAS